MSHPPLPPEEARRSLVAQVASAPRVALERSVWRGHRRRYQPLDHAGSLLWSGRFNLAPPDATNDMGWPALYLALDLAVAVGEIQRNMSRDDWDSVLLTEIAVTVRHVVDLRGLPRQLVEQARLFDDWDYRSGHELSRAVRDTGAEAMLIASATRLGDSLVTFPDQVRPGSSLTIIRTVEPDLTKATR